MNKKIVFQVIAAMLIMLLAACSDNESNGKKSQFGAVNSNLTEDQHDQATPLFEEGVNYSTISGFSLNSVDVDNKGQSVTEFFWYGCPHCLSFAPKLEAWGSKKPSVSVNYIPIIWNEQTELHAKLFFLIQQKDNFEVLHKKMFELVAGFSRTDTIDDQKVIFVKELDALGVSAVDVVAAFDDTAFQQELSNVLVDMKNYQIKSVPTVIAQNKYKVLNDSLTSMEQSLPVLEWLLEKAE